MTHKLNRLLALMLAVIMTFSMLLIPVEAASFGDVADSSWYAAAVEYVSERGWMAGVSETSFAPNTDVTRGMMVTVLARLVGASTDNDVSAFTDTTAGKWYTGAAAWAEQKGIVTGVGSGRFAPNRAITRQDLCVMLYKYLRAADVKLENTVDRTFSDMDGVSEYAREAVIYCTGIGLISGFENGTFRAKSTATRAQLAQILMRLDLLIKEQQLPAEFLPAQSFEGEAGEDMTISVEAPEGALPGDSDMSVSRVTDEALLNELQEKANGEVYAAADISFSKDGDELEPRKNVEVLISLAGLEQIENPQVIHRRDDGVIENVSAECVSLTRGGGKALRFYAHDFSVYAVTGGEGGAAAFNVTINFYIRKNQASGPSSTDSNWELINKQIIRSNQIDAAKDNDDVLIFDPGVPELKSTQAFEGWARTKTFTDSDDKLSVADMNANIKADYKSGTLNASVERSYYAEVYDVVYITYHDQAGAVLETESIHAAPGTTSISFVFDRPYTPFKGDQKFFGWITSDYVTAAGEYPTYAADAASNYFKADGATSSTVNYSSGSNNVDVYPYLARGYWLIFDNNISVNNNASHNNFDDATSASYTEPKLYLATDTTTAPTAPTRTGYTFGGWYSDADMTRAFTWGTRLTKDTTVYAKWTPARTKYSIVIWTQKVSDAADTDDSNNTYDYYAVKGTNGTTTLEYTETTGTTVNLSSLTSTSGKTAINRLGRNDSTSSSVWGELGYFFTYNGTKSTQSIQVKGDGSSVFNIYYDRAIVTINFYDGFTRSTSSTSTLTNNAWYYIYYNYNYVLVQYSSDGYLYDTDGYYYSPSSYTKYYAIPGTKTTSTGLYERAYDNWPSAGSGKRWYLLSSTSTPYITGYSMSIDADSYKVWLENNVTVWNLISIKFSHTNPYTLTIRGQDTDGNYTIDLGNSQLGKGATLTLTNELFTGYKMAKYDTTPIPSTKTQYVIGYYGSSYTGTIDQYLTSSGATLYYDREKYQLSFMSNNSEVKTDNVYYQGSLSEYADFEPTNGPTGYYFDGWYADATFNTKIDFTTEKMPRSDVRVYAKWTMIRFRTVLDYNAEGDTVTFPGNQADSFRLDYGEQVRESAIMAAERDGYVLLGWYYKENGTGDEKEFNFAMGANEDMADMSYGTKQEGETDEAFMARMNSDARTGSYQVVPNATGQETWTDKWTATNTERANVRGKIVIYAKWREDPDGVIGMRVKYYSDNNTDTGYFAPDTDVREWLDPNIYVDQAKAYAQPASTPDNTAESFLYWEVLDKDGNPTGRIAYPGQTWDVYLRDALEEKTLLPDPRCDHSGSRTHHDAVAATCTDPGSVEYWKCDNCGKCFDAATGGNLITNVTIDPLGHNWGTPTYTWNPATDLPVNGTVTCTGTAVCGRDSSHTVTETVTAAWVVDAAATTSDTGTAHYEATFTNTDAFTKQKSASVTIPVLTGYTVTFSVPNGVTAPADQLVEPNSNADLTVTPTGTIDGYTFLGWVAETVDNSTTAVTPLESYTVTEDTTLYALYTKTVTGEPMTVYELVTAAPSDWSGSYVITGSQSESYVTAVLAGIADGSSYESASTTGDVAFASTDIVYDASNQRLSNVDSLYVFNVEKYSSTSSYYTIKNASTSTYLYSNSGTLYASSSSGTTRRWTLSMASSNDAVTAYNSTSTSYSYLYYLQNSGDTSDYFFGLGSGAGTTIHFWRETNVETETTYYTTEISTYTVSFSVPSGATAPAAQVVASGGSITLPTGLADVNGWSFVGWIASELADTTTAPTVLTSYTPTTAESTLYAVYTHDVATGNVTYQLVEALDDGGTYIIVDSAGISGTTGYAVGNSSASSDHYLNAVTVTINNDVCTVAASSLNSVLWTASGNASSGYSFYNSAVGKYMGLDSSEYLYPSDTALAWAYTSNKYLDNQVDSAAYYYLSYSTTDNRYTTSKSGNAINLYKETPVTESHYATTWTTSPTSGGNAVTEPAAEIATIPAGTAAPTAAVNPTDPVRATTTVASWDFETDPGWTFVDSDGDTSNWSRASSTNTTTHGGSYALRSNSYASSTALTPDNWAFTSAVVVPAEGTTTMTFWVHAQDEDWPGDILRVYAGTSASVSSMTALTADITAGEWTQITVDLTAYAGQTIYIGFRHYNCTDFFAVVIDDVVITNEVTEIPVTWTVAFVDYDGSTVATVTDIANDATIPSASIPADPTREEYYFVSWQLNGADFDFNTPITGNITLTATYTPMYAKTFTVRLRAVYGLKNTTGLTHIYWYANDGTDTEYGLEGAGARYEMNDLEMNVSYNVPTPSTWTDGAWKPGQTIAAPTGLSRTGYTFLGWARLNTTGSGTYGYGHDDLKESDLYLKWDAVNNCYIYNDENRTVYPNVTQVYADESQPYHDMYAVWAPTYYYVFHSSTGVLEQHSVRLSSDSSAAYKDRIQTENIAALVPDDYLYGGYYKTYGGVNMTELKTEIARHETKAVNANSKWTADGHLPTFGIDTLEFTAYDGSKAKAAAESTTRRFWTKNDAYGQFTAKVSGETVTHNDPAGNAIKPVAGEIYYLKEVPQSYLTSKYVYTYDKNNENKLQEFFMLTLVDDSYYRTIGFRTVDGATTNTAAAGGPLEGYDTIASTINIYEQGNDTPLAINAASFGKSSGYVAMKQKTVSAGDSFSLMPGWTTLDGIDVNSHGALKLDVYETKVTYEPLETGAVMAFDKLYVDVTAVNNFWGTVEDEVTAFYFFNNTGNKWVTASKVDGTDMYVCSIPEGTWNAVIVARFGKGTEIAFDKQWTKTVDISLDGSKNLITISGDTYANSVHYASLTGVYNP